MTAEPTLTISVVVVNWNGGELLQDCLASLVRDAETIPSVEVVVVDNGSTDGSAETAEQAFPGIRVLRSPTNEGFAGGADAGIRASTGEVVVLVNNDATVAPGFLRAITLPFLGQDGVAAVTGRVLLAGRFRPTSRDTSAADCLVARGGARWMRSEGGVRLLNSTGNLMSRSGNGQDRDWLAPADAPPAAVEVFGFNGGCAALRRRALDEVGGFDRTLFMYYEDTELSWRLRRAGWRIVHAHQAVTEHKHAASSGTATEFFQVHNARNRLLVGMAHAPWPVFLRGLIRTVARLATGPRRRRTARALGQFVLRTPHALAVRRATDRAAVVPRHDVARWLVDD
jgi:GT2 family glycosyltransferase